MATWADIQTWTPDPLLETGRALTDQRTRLVRAAKDADAARSRIQSTGETADSMRASLDARIAELDRTVNDVSELIMATAEFQDEVADIRTLVQDCHDQAAEATPPLVIASDGGVTWKPSGTPPQYGPYQPATDPNRFKAMDLAQDITAAVESATRADTAYSKRLTAVRNGTYRSTEDHDSASPGLPNLPQKGWSPAEVSAWWNALSPQEREKIIHDHPDAVGNLDGIDMASRDQANRLRLPAMLDQAQDDYDKAAADALAAARSGDDAKLAAASAAMAAARKRLTDLTAVKDALANGSDRHLLLLDQSGERLKAAVASGDVDHAAHVATFVPGMTTTVGTNLDGYTRDMEALRDQTMHTTGASRSDVATIAWLGYDAPGWDLGVAGTGKAQAGADRLAPFLEGIQSSREASGAGDPHQTLLGHSYGSTTSGLAMKQVQGDTVDDFVMFGSPGSGAQDLREYNIDPHHVYVSAVPQGDAIQGIGPDAWFGKNPTKLDGIQHLSGDATASARYDDTPTWQRSLEHAVFPWTNVTDPSNPFVNHSTYLDDGTETQKDFARVVGGAK